jgi:ribonuclease HI
MKKLKFKPQLIPKILNREVSSTWRLFDDKDLQIGDYIEIIDSESQKSIGYAHIDQVTTKFIKDINSLDQKGYSQYENTAAIINEFRQYYGPEVDNETPMKIINFTLLDKKPTEKDVKTSTKITEVKLYTDGGSRGNPGPSACAFVLLDKEDHLVEQDGVYLGITTNNQAEYQAVKFGLKCAQNRGSKTVHVFMDSLLVVNQMIGVYKIRNRDLWPIHQEIVRLIGQFEKVSFTHIPREMNKLADQQVNSIIDAQDMSGISSELI